MLRRSQRARTPTRHFLTEVATAAPRKQQSTTAGKPPKKSPRKKQPVPEEEEETDEEDFDVQRSEYELRSRFARRRSPRRHEEPQPMTPTKTPKKTPRKRQHLPEEEDTDEEEFVIKRSEYELRSRFAQRRSPRRQEELHYFNSELPQPRRPQGNNRSVAPDGTTPSQPEPVSGGAATSKIVLSSDEEEERGGGRGGGGQEISVTPQISVYESEVRKRLSSLSSLTRKKVAEALTSLTGGNGDKSASTQTNPTIQSPEASKPVQPPTALSSSLRAYGTLSHTDPHPMESLPTPSSTVVTRKTLRSSTTITTSTPIPAAPKTKRDPPPPPPPPMEGELSTDSPPDIAAFEPKLPSEKIRPPSSPVEKMPQWMKFGWEETVFVLIVIGLLLFAYYCFYSDDC